MLPSQEIENIKNKFMNFLKGSEQSFIKFNDLRAIIKQLTT